MKKLLDLYNTLLKYYETGKKVDFLIPKLNDPREKWLFDQLMLLVNELRKNGLNTMDIHPGNLGFKSNGQLGMYDLGGYGIVGQEYNSDLDLDFTDLNTETYDFYLIGKKIMKNLGIKSSRYLGGGAYGIAYDIGNNRVLKITRDANEAKNSKKMIGKNVRHLSKVYEVKHFTTNNSRSYYSIILEKLERSKRLTNIYYQLTRTIYRQSIIVNTYHIKSERLDLIKDPLKRNIIKSIVEIGYYKTEEIFGDKINVDDIDELIEISKWVVGSKTNINSPLLKVPQNILLKLSRLIK